MNKNTLYMVLVLMCCVMLNATGAKPFPISYCISETRVVENIPKKDKDFALYVPNPNSRYIYNTEEEYYKDYQRSYFAVTCKKGGWDCLRHYEILANGCIPYFIDIDKCPPNTLYFLPKNLIKEAMHLEGVSYMHIDHAKFDCNKYYAILEKILAHTRKYLTTRSMAEYLLNTVNYSGSGKVLLLSLEYRYETKPRGEYLRDLMIIGLRELLQDKFVEFPRIDFLYKTYLDDTTKLYGRGFSYTKVLKDLSIDRTDIKQKIKNKEFELIVFSCIHDAMRLREDFEFVAQYYEPESIVYLCKDEGEHKCEYACQVDNLFIREYSI